MKPKKLDWKPLTPGDRKMPTALYGDIGEYRYTISVCKTGELATPFSLNAMKGQTYLEHSLHASIDEAKRAAQQHFDETVITLIAVLTESEPEQATETSST